VLKSLFFAGILKVNNENSRIRIQDPDPFVRGMDPRIRIRIHTKMSWIRNTAYNCRLCIAVLNFVLNSVLILIGQKEDRVWGVAYQIGNVVFALYYSLLLVAFSCCRDIFSCLDDDIWERSVREQLDFREKVFTELRIKNCDAQTTIIR
jgi:hypothetical protein